MVNAMIITKILQIRQEDEAVWDKARELTADRLSQFLTRYLKLYIASKEAEADGYRRIELRYRDDGKMPMAKGFYGRWLIPLEKAIKHDQRQHAVAITMKGNIVIFDFTHEPSDNGTFKWGLLNVFPSIEEAGKTYPFAVIAAIMEQIGVEVEELDI